MNSLRIRLIIAAGLILTVFVLLIGYTLDRAFYISTDNSLRSNMNTQLTLLMASAEVPNLDDVDMSPKLLATKFSLPSSGLYGYVLDDKGRVLWKSLSTAGVDMPEPRVLKVREQEINRITFGDNTFYLKSNGVEWYVEGRYVPLTFNIFTDLSDFNKTISEYRQTLWGWLFGLAAILLPAQIIVLVWVLTPLRQVISEISDIESGKQESITKTYPKEILRLTDNINGLLEYERKQQTRYRNALADLAHSLKTPLATLNSSFSEIKENPIYPGLVEHIQRMSNIIDHQLQRAATVGASPVRKSIAVEEIVNKLVRALAKVYRDKQIQFSVDVPIGMTVRIDEGDLMELMGNLLDNACKWCDQHIDISASIENGHTKLRVADDGPGIDQEQVEIILERGGRLDQSLPGQGIGLSIVNDIVLAYHGVLRVTQSETGGAAFMLNLPAS